ncbi:MAG: hypothetical protein ABIW82_06350 [Dokdonella sp.]
MPYSYWLEIQRRRLPMLILILEMSGSGLVAHSAAITSPTIEHYVGTASDASGHVLYTESHWISEFQGRRELFVLFECPDGRPFARKHVRAAGLAQAPSFVLDDARTGYQEGVRDSSGGSREVFVRTVEDQPEKSASLKSVPGLVVDAGFDSFVREHWDALATGAPQHLDFLLPSRLQSYPFNLRLVDDEWIDGIPVRRFLLQLDAWYAFAIPPIRFAYATDSRTIREYEGTSNLRDHSGKRLNVRIQFPAHSRTTMVDLQSLADAKAARLDGVCTL